MKKAILLVLIGISFISLISSGVYAGSNVAEKLTIIAGNYDVDKSTTTATKKGRDGAACSSDDECKGVCKGGSCCTDHGDSCNSSSHCCGYQSCNNGTCP